MKDEQNDLPKYTLVVNIADLDKYEKHYWEQRAEKNVHKIRLTYVGPVQEEKDEPTRDQ